MNIKYFLYDSIDLKLKLKKNLAPALELAAGKRSLIVVTAFVTTEKLCQKVIMTAKNVNLCHTLYSVNPPPLFKGGLRFLKNHRREGQDLLLKMGEGVIHLGGCLYKGSEHCFSLIMYRFCSNSALYSASLSFKIFIFLF